MTNIDLGIARRIVLAVAVAIMVACSWLAPLESAANQQIDAGLKRTLTIFATARALNGVISVMQGTDFAADPGGVGLIFAPGQILLPLNELVEQFAHLMLVAGIAFGSEKVLISIGSYWLISLVLTTVAIGWGYCYLRRLSSPAWLTRILMVLLMIRFAMPIVIIGADMLFQQFMAADYIASQRVIETTTAQLNSLDSTAVPTTAPEGIIDKIKGWVSQHTHLKAHLTNLKQVVEQATERIIKLMVIFLLQTLVLPLFLLWALWGVVRGTFEIPPRASAFITPGKRVESSEASSSAV